jgi:hypothetical protein
MKSLRSSSAVQMGGSSMPAQSTGVSSIFSGASSMFGGGGGAAESPFAHLKKVGPG